MKKIIVTVFLISLSISLAFANPDIGDKINDVLFTDIITTINGQEVESFNINGRTAIYVKDAKKLGYDVLFNSDERLVTITNNEELIPKYSDSKLDESQFQNKNIGDKINDVLFTDIKTVINDKAVESFNINNSTAIYATALKNTDADVTWLEDTRQVVISNIEKTNTTPKQATDFGFLHEINNYLNKEQDMPKVDITVPDFIEKSEFKYLIKEINSEEDNRILDLESDLGEYTYDEEFINIKIDGNKADRYGIRKANEVNDQMYDYKRANEVYYIPIQSIFSNYDADFFTTKYLSFGIHEGTAYYFIKDRNYFYKNFQKVYYKDVPGLESKVIEITTLSRNNELFIPAKMLNEVFFFNAYTLQENEMLLDTTPKQAPDFGFSPEINDYLNREQDMSKIDRTAPNFLEKSEFRYLIKEINSEEDKRVLDLEYDLGEYTYDRYLPPENQWFYGAEELSDEVDNYVISNIGKFRTMDGGGIDFFTESTRGNNGVFLHKLATQSHALRRDMRGLIDEPQDVLGEENIKILQKGDYQYTKIYTGGYYGESGVNITVLNPISRDEEYDNDLQIQWAGFGFENFVYMRAVFKQYFGIEEGERAYQILVNSYLKGDEYKDLEKFNFKKVYRFGDRNLAIVPNESTRSGGIYFYISHPGNFNYVDYINEHGMKWGY